MSLLLLDAIGAAFVARDSAGRVLPGATLTIYLSGTTELADSLTASTNPVVADANGEFEAFTLDPAEYRVELRTAAGVLVWTVDPLACSCDAPGAINFRSPVVHARTAGGVPYPGATLTFTDSATEVPVNAYADEALTIPVPNPLTANAGGWFPPVYLDDTVSYHVRLADAAGNTLSNHDPYECVCEWLTPEVTTIDPDTVLVDSGAFTLTVNGANFTEDSYVTWDGSPRTTVFVSSSQLTASILATDVDEVATVAVRVTTPGVGTSNAVNFSVANAAWTPADITTLLWLDADDAATITDSGSGFVSQWADKSGNAYHAVATGTQRPTLTASGLNSKPVITFNGTSNEFGLIKSFDTAQSAYSAYIVVKVDADPPADPNQTGLWYFSSITNINFRNSHYPWIDSVIYETFGSSATRKTVGNPTPALTSPRIYNVDSASGAWTARLDATQIFTTATNTVGMAVTPYIGLSYGGENRRLDGYIAELVLVPSVLSQAIREKMEGYLAHKWGLTGSLPGAHPYKSTPPSP